MNRERVYSVVALAAAVAFFVGLDLAICPMAGFWGIPCPSCGLTRASLELMNGNWRSAFATHPGVVPVLIYLSVAALGARWWNRSAAFSRFGSGVGIVLLVCLTLLWGARFFGHFGGPVPVHAWRF